MTQSMERGTQVESVRSDGSRTGTKGTVLSLGPTADAPTYAEVSVGVAGTQRVPLNRLRPA